MADKQMANETHQDYPHREGQGNNVNASSPGNKNSKVNNSQPMNNMMNDSEEQKAGREKNKDKEDK
jgi:hypothetical protein